MMLHLVNAFNESLHSDVLAALKSNHVLLHLSFIQFEKSHDTANQLIVNEVAALSL